MKRSHVRTVAVLLALLGAIWWVYDGLLVKKVELVRASRFSFEGKVTADVRLHLINVGSRYLTSDDADDQIDAAVHMIEIYLYLLYSGKENLRVFYNFLKTVLTPEKKLSVKDIDRYEYEAMKFLRKRRRIKWSCLQYEVSEPIYYRHESEEMANVYVVRTMENRKEVIKYYFKKADNRFYLTLRRDFRPFMARFSVE